jgi:orotidine-5'-phosphate decarboxylase
VTRPTFGAAGGGFGTRLHAALAERGPLCVGIDPHPGLLAAWDLTDDAAGLERLARTVVSALADRVAVLKPQVAFFERHGSRGLAVLERVVAEARSGGALVLNDAKRGDIGSTMQAYADAWLGPASPLAGDAVTVSPYLGLGALRPALVTAREHGRGVFVLALTSNPEGAAVQHAVGDDGRTVAAAVLAGIAAANAAELAAGAPLGSVGAVVGATVGPAGRAAAGGSLDVGGPLLAPGLGAQGASPDQLRAVFGTALPDVLPSVSREVLAAGPSASSLQDAAERIRDRCAAALARA